MIRTNVMLTPQQHLALEVLAAYTGGFISLGKLAEALGVDPLTARNCLHERGIEPQVQSVDKIMADAAHA